MSASPAFIFRNGSNVPCFSGVHVNGWVFARETGAGGDDSTPVLPVPTSGVIFGDSNESNNGTSSGGMTTAAKVGLGLGIPLALLAIAGGVFGFVIWRRRGRWGRGGRRQPAYTTENDLGLYYQPGQSKIMLSPSAKPLVGDNTGQNSGVYEVHSEPRMVELEGSHGTRYSSGGGWGIWNVSSSYYIPRHPRYCEWFVASILL